MSKLSVQSAAGIGQETGLPVGWKNIKFTDILEIKGGSQPPKKDFIYKPKKGYIRLLQIRDFGDNPYPTYVPISSKLRFVESDELLLARYGGTSKGDSLGRVCTGMEGAYNVALVKLLFNRQYTPITFVKYLFGAHFFIDVISKNSRSCQTGFNKGDLGKVNFPLPPLNEQKRIAARLDKIIPRIDKVKERLDKMPQIIKRFRQSVLTVAVTGKLTEDWRKEQNSCQEWKNTTFETVIIDGPKNGIYKSQDFYGKGVLILRIDNFYAGEVNGWGTLKRLSINKNEQESYKLSNDDIVINRVNSMPFLGKSALVKELEEPCVFESNMMRIQIDKEQIEPKFLIRFLNSQHGLVELRKNAKHAVNQSSINQQDVKAVHIPIPPLEEQKEIVRQVDKLFTLADKLESHYQKAKERVDKLSQSVLAKAFRGELVINEAELAKKEGREFESAEMLLERIKIEKAKMEAAMKTEKKILGKKRHIAGGYE